MAGYDLYKNPEILSDHVPIHVKTPIGWDKDSGRLGISITFHNMLKQMKKKGKKGHGNNPWNKEESDNEYQSRLKSLDNLYQKNSSFIIAAQEAGDDVEKLGSRYFRLGKGYHGTCFYLDGQYFTKPNLGTNVAKGKEPYSNLEIHNKGDDIGRGIWQPYIESLGGNYAKFNEYKKASKALDKYCQQELEKENLRIDDDVSIDDKNAAKKARKEASDNYKKDENKKIYKDLYQIEDKIRANQELTSQERQFKHDYEIGKILSNIKFSACIIHDKQPDGKSLKTLLVSIHGEFDKTNPYAKDAKIIFENWLQNYIDKERGKRNIDYFIIGGDFNRAKIDNKYFNDNVYQTKATSLESNYRNLKDGEEALFNDATRDKVSSDISSLEMQYNQIKPVGNLQQHKVTQHSGRVKYKGEDIKLLPTIVTKYATQVELNEKKVLITGLNGDGKLDSKLGFVAKNVDAKENNIFNKNWEVADILYNLMKKHKVDFNFVKSLVSTARGYEGLQQDQNATAEAIAFSRDFQREATKHGITTGNLDGNQKVGMRTKRISSTQLEKLYEIIQKEESKPKPPPHK